jgi:hypothetical protein
MPKRPDNFSKDANILPYASNISAPPITLPDVSGFRQTYSHKASSTLSARYEELKREYEKLMALAEDNNKIYNAKYNFIPVVGQIYHLYNTGNEYLLSMIEPSRWKLYEFTGSYRHTTDSVWERIE